MGEKLSASQTEHEGSEHSGFSSRQRARQRLVVCLDGSWNRRGSGTNIYHLSNLVQRGRCTDAAGQEWRQRVYYDEGVGTGVLDRISGGAFGAGLSENVRQAYDWLVENYNDGDEVFIFGFSRGAFTARSLVGLIAKCGLVLRGAPIPQEQLWDGYRMLGSNREWRGDDAVETWTDRLRRDLIPFRPLKFLKEDDWPEADRGGRASAPLNQTERLLVQWSRRISIKCLAVFDTVGTFGVEAIAIPWLQARQAMFHDTSLSSCVLNAVQALAIDEHRANFGHIPWRRVLPDAPSPRPSEDPRIQQRWFIGAHSNVGGGYEDDTLAQFPLHWVMAKCSAHGLQFAPLPPEKLPNLAACIPLNQGVDLQTKQLTPANIGDSFSCFIGGLWRYVLRNKRNYRRIAPPVEFQLNHQVQSVDEHLHSSVLDLIAQDQAASSSKPYNPPNLWEYLHRTAQPGDASALPDAPKHVHLEGAAAWKSTGVWLLGIAGAGLLIVDVTVGWHFRPMNWLAYFLALIVGPALAFGADWAESLLNHRLALSPDKPVQSGAARSETSGTLSHPLDALAERRRGWLDQLLNIRLFCLGASLVGLVFLALALLRLFAAPVPAAEVLWLFGLGALAIRLNASWRWTGVTLTDLGLPVGKWLRYQGYAARFPSRTEPATSVASNPADTPAAPPEAHALELAEATRARRQWLQRALWRDLVGFVPAAAFAMLFGWWLTLTLASRQFGFPTASQLTRAGMNTSWQCWAPALAFALIFALVAWAANYQQRGRIRTSAPSAATFSMTRILFALGIAGYLAAMAWLAALQAWHALWCARHHQFVNLTLVPGATWPPAWLGILAALFAWTRLRPSSKAKRAHPALPAPNA